MARFIADYESARMLEPSHSPASERIFHPIHHSSSSDNRFPNIARVRAFNLCSDVKIACPLSLDLGAHRAFDTVTLMFRIPLGRTL
jgi:hypothetical protein